MPHRLLRRVAAVALLVAAASPAGPAAATRAAQPQSPPPAAYIVVDADSGAIVAAGNEHAALPPASTAKIMTALVAAERLPPDAVVTVSELAAQQPPSKITMTTGQQWKLNDVLAAVVMVSANDAAYALAEAAGGGTLEGFADAANATAKRYGMKDSILSDPAGFDDELSFRGGPRMSAYDIAIATRNALEVPIIATLAATREIRFTDPAGVDRSLLNHNKMLPEGTRAYADATGFKTGYTNAAGHTLVATAERDGRTCIAVVLNTYDTYGWAAQYLDQCFAAGSDPEGTGDELPEVRVSLHGQRVEDRQGFLALARGLVSGGTTTSATDAVAGGFAASTTIATTPERTTTSARSEAEEGSGGLGLGPKLLIGFAVLLAVVVALRRRAVVRRRARRQARRRTTAAMMRRGGLPVVDGRYRTGTRLGPPVESHVRVHRTDADDEGGAEDPDH